MHAEPGRKCSLKQCMSENIEESDPMQWNRNGVKGAEQDGNRRHRSGLELKRNAAPQLSAQPGSFGMSLGQKLNFG